MQWGKTRAKRVRDRLLSLRRLLAGKIIDGIIHRAQTSAPDPVGRAIYLSLVVVYAVKRLLQDLLVGKGCHVRALPSRLREIETNLLIRLIVWRDAPPPHSVNLYEAYAQNNRLTAVDRDSIRQQCPSLIDRPLVSVVVPVYNATPEWIDRLVRSVSDQLYDRWELVLVDDGSTDPRTWPALVTAADRDERIVAHRQPTNAGVVSATNHAVGLSNGEWIAFVDHDDELTPDALFEIALAINRQPDADVVYSDEEIVDDHSGSRYPHLKPAFSPILLTAYNYICHLLVVRRSKFEEIGGLRSGTDGAQDFDLILRLAECTDRFVHIPRVLYRWHVVPQSLSRRVDPASREIRQEDSIDPITRRIVAEHLSRRGIAAEVEIVRHWARPAYHPVDRGMVTIIIPTKDQPRRLRRCVESIERRTDYPNYEILIVDNDSQSHEAGALLKELATRWSVRSIASGPEGFNFSKLNNRAAEGARGEYLLFLNDDTFVQDACWLSAMVATLQFPKIGAVGARLLYPNGRNQHAGLIVGALGWGPWHALVGVPGHLDIQGGYMTFPHQASAVTGACMLTRRRDFAALGGFDEDNLAVSFNDVDYCLRLRQRGFEIAYAAQAVLTHDEGASRGRYARPAEVWAMKQRYHGYQDPFWNPNYSRLSPHFSLSPRRRARGTERDRPIRVLYRSDEPGDASILPMVLGTLESRGEIEIVDRSNPWSSRERFDVLLVEGMRDRSILKESANAGLPTLWSLPRRLMLPARATDADRAAIVEMVLAMKFPYQVVFADPFAVGWGAAGMPRANLDLVCRAPAMNGDRPVSPADRKTFREFWGLSDADVVIVAELAAGEEDSIRFLMDVFASLPSKHRQRAFLVVMSAADADEGLANEFRKRVSRLGGRAAVLSRHARPIEAGDVFLAHQTVEARPMAVMQALQGELALVATPLVEQGDLLHPPLSGIRARPFVRRDWRRALVRLIEDADARRRIGLEGRYWLESRESFEDAVGHWRDLIVESAELHPDRLNLAESPRPRDEWESSDGSAERRMAPPAQSERS